MEPDFISSIPDAGISLRPDPDQMRAMLSAIVVPGSPFEIRALKCRKLTADGLEEDPFTKVKSGYFTDVEAAVAHAVRFTGNDCSGVHVTVNPLAAHVCSWGLNRIKKGKAAGDADVVRYRCLYIDIDAKRPPDTNATKHERAAARARAKQLLSYLCDLGWPTPAWAGSSGSGSLLLYHIDLEPTDADLVQRVLQKLSERFSDGTVVIDTSTGNPGRLVRLAGSVNAKSITPTPDRPWKLATGKAPSRPGIVSRGQLEAIAAGKSEPVTGKQVLGIRPQTDMPLILSNSGISFRQKPKAYGTVFETDDCLTSSEHQDGACFIQFTNGAVGYKCHHNSCSEKTWHDVKPLLTLPDHGFRTSPISIQNGALGKVIEHDGQVPGIRLRTRRVSTIEARAIDWIWESWLPAGMLTLFAGYGGSGKSTVVLSIAAACSSSGTFPDGQQAPLLNTLVFAAEDSPEHTIRPRLDGLGADLDRIHIVDGIVRDGDAPGWVQLRNHAVAIEQAVIDHRIGLVIIDPVSSYIGDANSDKESDVRSGLTPLIGMAERTGAAVLMIRHVSKTGDGARAAARILGSTAWHDVPRMVWMLADAPDEHQPAAHEDGTRDTTRVLGVVKTNLVAKPQARWGVQPARGPLHWLPDASPVSIDECFVSQSARGSKLRDAEAWLAERLAGGAQQSKTVESAAKTVGFSEATLRRARESLNVIARKERTGEWVMSLPPGPVVLSTKGVQRDSQSEPMQQMNALPATVYSKALMLSTLSAFPEHEGESAIPLSPDADTGQN